MAFRWPCSAHLWKLAKCWLMLSDQEKRKSPHRPVYLVTDHRDHSWHGYDTINRCNEQSLWELDKGQPWTISGGHLQRLITVSTARYDRQHLQQQMPKTWPRETSRAVWLLCVQSKHHSESPPGIITPSLSLFTAEPLASAAHGCGSGSVPASALNVHHSADADFVDPTHKLDPENVHSHILIVQSIFYLLFYISIEPAGRSQHHKQAQLSLNDG